MMVLVKFARDVIQPHPIAREGKGKWDPGYFRKIQTVSGWFYIFFHLTRWLYHIIGAETEKTTPKSQRGKALKISDVRLGGNLKATF